MLEFAFLEFLFLAVLSSLPNTPAIVENYASLSTNLKQYGRGFQLRKFLARALLFALDSRYL
ncbi:hypothetical protein SPOG_00336 [Schizosaccharomyces cryophilus OY26]|uniref:Uncharacterized protein n=1 Tax=Schizosaccharomyces cryophilus (strain OY26 / ATCC MYA-4695 / CBS 11777 / NBRC 106824 / NRRL Y48691) TaxID=653667 RepID=S9W0H6_SCHCR|nr:uncharacterized protein SPOG_00336 [Schizosaccharomyces cryophilus OY26]EPY51914.1 hypothetical protein SPOG_00336 [Schizosaccharomyces cryophilus OY26]